MGRAFRGTTQRGGRKPEQVPVGPPDGATAAADATRTGTVAATSGTDAAATTGPEDGADHDTRFFGQPWALAHIFGVEMWERFSAYGMQGILLIYMYYSVDEHDQGAPRPRPARTGGGIRPRPLTVASPPAQPPVGVQALPLFELRSTASRTR
ncbi:hypothetical protein [Microbacterium sp. LWH3-1.2]|uniref:hypothetical protein n=1 Tax=Microbacterium sp. LWH3-1.2 TaxID=3135256 RepID=UPI0039C996C6